MIPDTSWMITMAKISLDPVLTGKPQKKEGSESFLNLIKEAIEQQHGLEHREDITSGDTSSTSDKKENEDTCEYCGQSSPSVKRMDTLGGRMLCPDCMSKITNALSARMLDSDKPKTFFVRHRKNPYGNS